MFETPTFGYASKTTGFIGPSVAKRLAWCMHHNEVAVCDERSRL